MKVGALRTNKKPLGQLIMRSAICDSQRAVEIWDRISVIVGRRVWDFQEVCNLNQSMEAYPGTVEQFLMEEVKR